MDADRWSRVQDIFEAALDRPSAERDAFLGDACAGDEALRREVESLLAADTAGHSLFGGNALDALGRPSDAFANLVADSEAAPMRGKIVGPYRLLQELGRGGMGVVYLAERADGAFEQRVALKLVKRGMDSDEILRRFRAERQILAGLRHPGIARLLDGGRTDDGRPYLAVEHVEGEPIDAYCDRRRLPIDARLRLFEQVCEAVQYAHRNLVVHRDLKPSNILVTEEDGVAHVKLLDFGIAKLLNPGAAGHLSDDAAQSLAVQTRTGLWVMTPEYAAPEQVRGEQPSTATDVYALGVLLYELLTGHRPYRVPSRVAREVERAILEDEPERPSTALTKAPDAAVLSRARAADTGRLRRRIAGDLDMICLMALRKEPDRRYHSAALLLDDIRRHLGGLPVAARPDAAAYRLRKFISRHRHGVAAAAGVFILSAGLVGFYTVQLRHERDRAQVEAEKAEQVIGFIEGLFESSDPSRAHGDTLTVRQVMEAGATRLTEELEHQPAVRARLMQVIGRVYKNLALYDEATPLLKQAVAEQRQAAGATSQELAASIAAYGEILHYQHQFDAADSLYREALALQRSIYAGPHLEIAATLDLLSRLEQERSHFARAESLVTEALAMRRELVGEDHLDLAESLQTLALLRSRQGDHAGAEQPAREALALRRKLLGADHPEIIELLHNLAANLHLQGKYEEAEPIYREGLALVHELYTKDHLFNAYFLLRLGSLMQDRKEYEKADSMYHAARAISEANGNGSLVALSLNNLATLRLDEERYDEAESYVRQALEQTRAVFGDKHAEIAARLHNLGRILSRQDRHEEAATALREALAIRDDMLGPTHPNTLSTRLALGAALTQLNVLDEAELLLRGTLAILEEEMPNGAWQISNAQRLVGALLTARARYPEAERMLTTAYGALLVDQDPEGRVIQDTRKQLAALYDAWGKPAEAARWR